MKNKILSLFFASTLLLTACGDDTAVSEDEQTTEDEIEEVESTEDKEIVEEDEVEETAKSEDDPEQQPGDIIEAQAGIREILAVNYGINESLESGPFTITVKNAQLSQFKPSEDMIEFFGSDDLAMVTLEVEAVNNSEDTNTIYPDQGIIVTDTGHQVDADLFLSDDVGGDFHGEVTKSGDIFFFFEDDASEVKNVRFIVASGHDDDFDSYGDDLEFSIDF